jgi:hypothetical protein
VTEIAKASTANKKHEKTGNEIGQRHETYYTLQET